LCDFRAIRLVEELQVHLIDLEDVNEDDDLACRFTSMLMNLLPMFFVRNSMRGSLSGRLRCYPGWKAGRKDAEQVEQ
jgi:hypothetical protein